MTNTWHYDEDVLEHRHTHVSENAINPGAFCNTFDLHLAITGLESNFLVFFLKFHI